ncbi:hypothetical protein CPB84DRAFT_810431 [Gymnopilus junonius]|uniref:Uncharacterized protein n=1 Tax=Gymnopilus junonius TaxID=109634 RepID=A0A9P5TPR6_GYMJU|nr:hypothetical protein CPB84DRAFT_810431 [Gymnopilus junonius]
MDELYALERQEAFRRAEFEARHAEALRRAQTQITSPIDPHHRISKSATTSPVMRNGLALASDDRNYYPLPSDRDWHGPAQPAPSSSRPSVDDLLRDQETDGARQGSKRRLSGPAWMPPPQPQHDPPLAQSKSSGHLVETMRGGGSTSSHHGLWSHPYHHPYHYRPHYERRGAGQHDESPSPISSDSEPLPAHERAYAPQSPPRIFNLQSAAAGRSHHGQGNHPIDSPPHYSSVRTTTSEFTFTPSTSPFLGPLRTLNIHSANPSRAPSPILLPPPSKSFDHGFYIGDEHPRSGGGPYGSPPSSANNSFMRGFGKSQQPSHGHGMGHVQRRSDGLYSSFHGHGPASSSQVPTPQLSSGPSSNGSSPASLAHGLSYHHPGSMSHSGAGGSGSDTLSASSSRAPSPLHWSRGSPPSTSFAHREQHGHNGHHLAHSVRLAFGMTPIHSVPPSRRSSPPPPPPPRNTSWSATTNPFNQHQESQYGPGQHAYSQAANYQQVQTPAYTHAGGASRPGSRPGSPPIRLAPLKSLPESSIGLGLELGSEALEKMKTDDEDVKKGVVEEKVELPGFSEIEAAALGHPIPIRPIATNPSVTTSPVTIAASALSLTSPKAPQAQAQEQGSSSTPDSRMSIDFVR